MKTGTYTGNSVTNVLQTKHAPQFVGFGHRLGHAIQFRDATVHRIYSSTLSISRLLKHEQVIQSHLERFSLDECEPI